MSPGCSVLCRAGESGNGQMGAVATAAVAALAVLTRSNRANRCAAVRHWLAAAHGPLIQPKAHASQSLMLAAALPAAADLTPACCCQTEPHPSHSSCCLVPTCSELVSAPMPSCTLTLSTLSTAAPRAGRLFHLGRHMPSWKTQV